MTHCKACNNHHWEGTNCPPPRVTAFDALKKDLSRLGKLHKDLKDMIDGLARLVDMQRDVKEIKDNVIRIKDYKGL